MATILLADDDAHTLRVLELWLSRHGHRVLEASDGAKALETLAGQKVDMLISDVNMPGVNGLELLKAVRTRLGLVMPIILLSSRCDQTALQEQVKPLHAKLYPKPFVPSRIVAEIQRLLEATSTVEVTGS